MFKRLEQKTGIFACNHRRAYRPFIESIKDKNGFQVKHCENNRIFAMESRKIGDKKLAVHHLMLVRINHLNVFFFSFLVFIVSIHNNFEQVVPKSEYRQLMVSKGL